jgi:hypothetical protein
VGGRVGGGGVKADGGGGRGEGGGRVKEPCGGRQPLHPCCRLGTHKGEMVVTGVRL